MDLLKLGSELFLNFSSSFFSAESAQSWIFGFFRSGAIHSQS
jgi:hypothetical protein